MAGISRVGVAVGVAGRAAGALAGPPEPASSSASTAMIASRMTPAPALSSGR